MTRVPLSCPACSREINYYFPSDLPSIWLLYPLPPSFPSFSVSRSPSLSLPPLPLHECTSQSSSFFSVLILSPLPFLPLSPRSRFSVDIWLLFGDLKLHVPPTPSVRLMFDKGPLKCADFRGCLADGLVGLQRVQAGGLPSERDQLLTRHCYPLLSPSPSSLALPRALGMRRSREGWAAEKVQVSSRARACGLGLWNSSRIFGTR